MRRSAKFLIFLMLAYLVGFLAIAPLRTIFSDSEGFLRVLERINRMAYRPLARHAGPETLVGGWIADYNIYWCLKSPRCDVHLPTVKLIREILRARGADNGAFLSGLAEISPKDPYVVVLGDRLIRIFGLMDYPLVAQSIYEDFEPELRKQIAKTISGQELTCKILTEGDIPEAYCIAFSERERWDLAGKLIEDGLALPEEEPEKMLIFQQYVYQAHFDATGLWRHRRPSQ
jgi:hypothetical protein